MPPQIVSSTSGHRQAGPTATPRVASGRPGCGEWARAKDVSASPAPAMHSPCTGRVQRACIARAASVPRRPGRQLLSPHAHLCAPCMHAGGSPPRRACAQRYSAREGRVASPPTILTRLASPVSRRARHARRAPCRCGSSAHAPWTACMLYIYVCVCVSAAPCQRSATDTPPARRCSLDSLGDLFSFSLLVCWCNGGPVMGAWPVAFVRWRANRVASRCVR